MSRYRIAFTWWPVRLAMRHHDRDGFDFIGWCWWVRARQVKNLHHGWIAFIEDQTPERLASCPLCDRPKETT